MPRGGGDALGGTVPARPPSPPSQPSSFTALRVLQIQFCSRPYKAKAILVLSIHQRWNSSPFLLVLPCCGKGPGDALCVGAQLGILRPFGLGVFSLTPAFCRLWGGTYGICCH